MLHLCCSQSSPRNDVVATLLQGILILSHVTSEAMLVSAGQIRRVQLLDAIYILTSAWFSSWLPPLDDVHITVDKDRDLYNHDDDKMHSSTTSAHAHVKSPRDSAASPLKSWLPSHTPHRNAATGLQHEASHQRAGGALSEQERGNTVYRVQGLAKPVRRSAPPHRSGDADIEASLNTLHALAEAGVINHEQLEVCFYVCMCVCVCLHRWLWKCRY
jgi:hypothetical protein